MTIHFSLKKLFYAFCLISHAGCTYEFQDQPPLTSFQENATDRQTILDILSTLDTKPLRDAFYNQLQVKFELERTVKQFNESGQELGTQTSQLLYQDKKFQTQETSLSGNFDSEETKKFLSDDLKNYTPSATLADYIIPDSSLYLSTLNQEQYHYRFLPDTTIASESLTVIEVVDNPSVKGVPQIYALRFYVDKSTNQLAGIVVNRLIQGFLFNELSTTKLTSMHFQEKRVPLQTMFDIQIKIPLSDVRHFYIQNDFLAYQ